MSQTRTAGTAGKTNQATGSRARDRAARVAQWEALAAEAFLGIKEWRLQHPKATFAEIEVAVDERLSAVRVRMLEDVALASAATTVSDTPLVARPACPVCAAGGPGKGRLEARGRRAREVTVTYGRTVTLTRNDAVCSVCETGLFPLDEELALWPGAFSPSIVEGAVRLGTWVPFERLPELLRHFTGAQLSASTIQRLTETAGAAYEAVQTTAVAYLERRCPPPPQGPAVQQLSVDGAMVPLRGKGEWAEVKTLVVGTVPPAVLNGEGALEVHATELSSFFRMADHATFSRLATVETHRRGTETAGTVCGVADGAAWCQQSLEVHRLDAVRILDFSHAAGYLAQVAQAAFGEGTLATATWYEAQRHALKHERSDGVLAAVRAVRDELTARPAGTAATTAATALKTVTKSLAYLEKRQDHLQYATFRGQGYPIGSGIVESAGDPLGDDGGRGPHEGRRHALGPPPRQPDARPAHRRLRRPPGRSLAPDRAAGPPPAAGSDHRPPRDPAAETVYRASLTAMRCAAGHRGHRGGTLTPATTSRSPMAPAALRPTIRGSATSSCPPATPRTRSARVQNRDGHPL